MSIINPNSLTDIQIEGIDYNDYPDFCDAFISYAYCTQRQRELTDRELEILNTDHSSFVYEKVQEHLF